MGKGNRLSEKEIDKIKRLVDEGYTYSIIAERFGVVRSTIGNIARKNNVRKK